MRMLLISDVHANIYALEAIEKAEKWDAAYCCGDLVDYGPFAAEALRWVQEHEVHCVRGNHDAHVLGLTQEDCRSARDERRWKWSHYNFEKIGEAGLAFLQSLPLTLRFSVDGVEYQMQHQYDQGYGTVESLDQFNRFWQGEGETRRLLFGHTHRRCIHMLDENTLWLNPGSASYRRPDDPDKRAHYMMIEDGQIRFGALEYDRTPLLEATQKLHDAGGMLETELQDGYFFFGDAPTSRSPLPVRNTSL